MGLFCFKISERHINHIENKISFFCWQFLYFKYAVKSRFICLAIWYSKDTSETSAILAATSILGFITFIASNHGRFGIKGFGQFILGYIFLFLGFHYTFTETHRLYLVLQNQWLVKFTQLKTTIQTLKILTLKTDIMIKVSP